MLWQYRRHPLETSWKTSWYFSVCKLFKIIFAQIGGFKQ